MKHSMQVAGLMVLAGMNVRAARDSRPADVTVYVTGDWLPPNSVQYPARATVTWMYARLGVLLAWRQGVAGNGLPSGSQVSIQVQYAKDSPKSVTPDALAFALPFRNGTTTITVIYNRIQFVAVRSTSGQAILAHVLAHEIGHVLQRTNQHAQTGIMKAHWDGHDYDAMEKKPLEFTPADIDLIVRGVSARKAQTAGEDTTAMTSHAKRRK